MNIPLNIHDWHTVLLLGSIGLLAAGVVLKAAMKSSPVPPAPDLRDTIEKYRPRAYH